MEASIRLGKIWGIPIGLHSSWFLVFGLVTWSLAVGYFPAGYPELARSTHWLLGLITSLLFFASVLFHELGHAWLALRNQIPVRAITLFIFGGVAQIESEPRSPGAEFRIAIAGPLASIVLAAGFAVIWWLAREVAWLAAPSGWLARINLALSLFNMIPGFPLDGGRVLRALVWRLTGSFRRASRTAAFTGQLVAFGFMGVGLFVLLTGNIFNGLWLAFIGWFLQNAAAASYAQSNIQQALSQLLVGQVMTRQWLHIPSKLPLSQLVEEHILRGGPRYYFVRRDGYGFEADDTRPYGMLTLTDVTRVPRASWGFTPADQAMVPWEKLICVRPSTPLIEALRVMDDANVAQVPVLDDNGDLVGVLSREQVLHYVRLRAELGA